MPEPLPLFPLALHEERRWAELGKLSLPDLKERYFEVSRKRSPHPDKPLETLLARRTIAELIIWYERGAKFQDRQGPRKPRVKRQWR